jgi:hypothetical protein
MWGRYSYLPLAGIVALATLVVAGCGGGDSAPVVTVQGASGASGAGGAAALSKPQYMKQADAICAEANNALSSLNSGAANVSSQVAATQELQITRSELDSLQSLTPPDQDRSTLKSYLSALTDEVAALMKKRDAADQGGDTSGADAEAASARSSAATAAGDYGLKDCAKGGQAQTTTTGGGAATTTTPVPTTTTPTTTVPTTPTTVAPVAPAPPSGGTAGGGTSGGGSTGGGTSGGNGGTGGSGGVSP